MLGELIGEITATQAAARILPDGTIEQSAQGTGRLLGTDVSVMQTVLITLRPDGTSVGEGRLIATTKEGETVVGKVSGLGIPKGAGPAASIRGVAYWQTQSQKLDRLNRIVGVFEAEQDAQGKGVGKIWEWK